MCFCHAIVVDQVREEREKEEEREERREREMKERERCVMRFDLTIVSKMRRPAWAEWRWSGRVYVCVNTSANCRRKWRRVSVKVKRCDNFLFL